MGKVIIETSLQILLLVNHINGILALIWKYDLYHRTGVFVEAGILVGDLRGNRSVIVRETEKFKQLLEVREVGYDLDNFDLEKLHLWQRGIIPYFIDEVSYDRDFRDNLRRMLMEVNYLSGIHFVELRNPPVNQELRYLYFVNKHRYSYTRDLNTRTHFTKYGVQTVELGYNSLTNGDMYALVMTIAGIPPQNNAPNRDRFITVKTDNILPDKIDLFDVLPDHLWLYHDLAYDYGSASHFRYHEYTKNGYATIKPKLDVPEATGQGFTFYDVLKMRRTYNYISDKIFIKVNDPNKQSYMFMTTTAPGEIATPFIPGMQFGNPDNPGQRYDQGKYGDSYDYGYQHQDDHKEPRDKHHRFVGAPHSKSAEDRTNEFKYDTFKANVRYSYKDEGSEENKSIKRIPRPKSNKYLGIPDDETEQQQEERPQHSEQEEVIRGDIGGDFSKSSDEGLLVTKPIKRRKAKITKKAKKSKNSNKSNKSKKSNKNKVHVNV